MRETLLVRIFPAATLALLCACQTPPPVSQMPTPSVPVAVQWPAGSSYVATVTPNLPDQPKWRAVETWWRDALGQSVKFRSCSKARLPSPDLALLELTVDAPAETLTSALIHRDGTTALASASFAPDSKTPDLLLALDHLAWCSRLALGEDALAPMPVAAITSPNRRVVIAIADATELLHTGAFASAHQTLRIARQQDGGSPFVLAPLAALELLRGDAVNAQRIAQEALGYTERTSATVQHRLARTMLMAKSARQPANTGTFDRQLHTLAKVAHQERPYDDEPVWTTALASNFLGDFAAARPLLEQLLVRQPEEAFVPYHLGWACLGTKDANAAANHLAAAARRLPAPWVLLPRAIALQEAGRTAELNELLERVLEEYGRTSRDSLTHQILRMQAASAILADDVERSRELLMADLRWLLSNPTALKNRAGEFAEEGALLVRLGSNRDLPLVLAAIQKQHVGSLVADAAAFIAGMHQLLTSGERPVQIERSLGRDGDNAWAALLAAYSHERLGEVGDMQNELARAARLSSSPMTKALLAKSLRAVGKLQEAELLKQTLRSEMLNVNLRQTCQHPVFGPELAFAFTLH